VTPSSVFRVPFPPPSRMSDDVASPFLPDRLTALAPCEQPGSAGAPALIRAIVRPLGRTEPSYPPQAIPSSAWRTSNDPRARSDSLEHVASLQRTPIGALESAQLYCASGRLSAFASYRYCAASRLCRKTQKFILRSASRPNQISFSHSLGHERTHALQKRSQEVGPPARCNPFPCDPERDRLPHIAATRNDRCDGESSPKDWAVRWHGHL
jgi:hypothetical protein